MITCLQAKSLSIQDVFSGDSSTNRNDLTSFKEEKKEGKGEGEENEEEEDKEEEEGKEWEIEHAYSNPRPPTPFHHT